MRKFFNKMKHAVFTVGLVSVLSVGTAAYAAETEAEEKVAVSEKLMGVATVNELESTEVTEGFFTGKDGKTYYKNADGVIVKDQIVTVNGKNYYLDKKGVRFENACMIYKDVAYHASKTGVLSTRAGWFQIGDDWYYSDKEGALFKNRWISGIYYMGKDGKMLTSTLIEWEEEKYYLGADGAWQRTAGWVKVGKYWYYIKEDGFIQMGGMVEDGGKTYFLDVEGRMLTNQIIVMNEKKYYITSTGALRKSRGWVTCNDKWYFCEEDGSLRCSATALSASKQTYYLNADGEMVTDQIVVIDEKIYYATKEGAFRTTGGWIKIHGDWYYSDAGGVFRANKFVAPSVKSMYYLGEDGKMVTDKVIMHKDCVYYVQKSGLVSISKGWMEIGKKWYYAKGGGELKRNEFQVYQGKKYFLGDDGAMVVNDGVVSDGYAYHADKDGVCTYKSGWVKSGGLWYYSDTKARLVKNKFLKKGGIEYFFDIYGVMQDGCFFYHGTDLYYANKGGEVRRKSGWFQVDGHWYFSNLSGVFYRNTAKTIKGTKYFFSEDGSLKENADYYDPTAVTDTSWTEINGRRYHVDKNGNVDSLFGIDVSAWQDDIDWKKVKADGVDFAFIRVGGRFGKTGEIYDDSLGVENIKKATEAGIPVGVYFFTQAVTVDEAIEEAKYTLNKIKGLNVTLPVVIDSENMSGGRHGKITPKERTAIIKAFCDTVKEAGYEPMYYAGMAWCVDGYVDVTQLTEYMHWCAQYWIRNQCDDYGVPYQIWQYSDSGTVDGIRGKVDCNIWYLVH